jgi:hypothetical protein
MPANGKDSRDNINLPLLPIVFSGSNTAGVSPTMFSVTQKPFSEVQKMVGATQKYFRDTPNVFSTMKKTFLAAQKMISKTRKAFAAV